MNQITYLFGLLTESIKTVFKNPRIFVYFFAYFILNSMIIQPYMLVPGSTPLIRSSINIILSLLLLVLFVFTILLTIKHTYAVLHNAQVSLAVHVQQLLGSITSILVYMLILGLFLFITGAIAFFISYKVTIPADITFSQLLNQLNTATQIGLAQHAINFLILLSIMYSICIAFWMFATFFVLPVLAIEQISIVQAFNRSWQMTRKHIVPVLGGIIITVLFFYAGDYLLSFVQQRILNALFFYFVITMVTVYSTILYVYIRKTLFTGQSGAH